jgi:Ca2+/Na+ antiporter
VAAVTLIAFGSAAPEILLNSVSVLEDNAGLSLPAIFGSGMIAFGFIPSVCILNTGLAEHPLTIKPILREV